VLRVAENSSILRYYTLSTVNLTLTQSNIQEHLIIHCSKILTLLHTTE